MERQNSKVGGKVERKEASKQGTKEGTEGEGREDGWEKRSVTDLYKYIFSWIC